MTADDTPNKYVAKYTVKSWLREEYVSKDRSIKAIANELNVPVAIISEHIHKFNIDQKPYADKEWLEEQYRFGGKELIEIAEETGVTKEVIKKWINRFDLQRAYKDEEWLRKQYIEHEKATYEIASMAGCSQGTIYNHLDSFGIETRDRGEYTNLPDDVVEKLKDKEWLQTQYVEKEKSSIEIADDLGVHDETVRRKIHKHGIEMRPSLIGQSSLDEAVRSKLTDEEWMQNEYVTKERSSVDIAAELNVDDGTVLYYLSEHDIDTRTAAETELGQEAYEKLEDEEWLRDQYINQEKSIEQIADELDVNEDTVSRRIHRYDIDTRNPAETQLGREAYEKLEDKEWLYDQYVMQDNSPEQIANELDVSVDVVSRRIRRHELDR